MEKNLEQSKIIIKKKGVVVSDKMAKTVVVAVDSFKTHPKYKKKYKSTKKYKVGDLVEIIPCRPMSKDKCYKVV